MIKWNSNLPPDEVSLNPHFILDCCRSTSTAILTPQYIVIAAQIFLLSSQAFNKVNTPFVLSSAAVAVIPVVAVVDGAR